MNRKQNKFSISFICGAQTEPLWCVYKPQTTQQQQSPLLLLFHSVCFGPLQQSFSLCTWKQGRVCLQAEQTVRTEARTGGREGREMDSEGSYLNLRLWLGSIGRPLFPPFCPLTTYQPFSVFFCLCKFTSSSLSTLYQTITVRAAFLPAVAASFINEVHANKL